ncbi:MAG TPA: hypothetical protein VFY59_09035, partial [Rubrobacter sp.]|nr:hypothetical protein [Rubrobacter sp.]
SGTADIPLSPGLIRVPIPRGPPEFETATTKEEVNMSEQRRAVHPQEPAEGGDDGVDGQEDESSAA